MLTFFAQSKQKIMQFIYVLFCGQLGIKNSLDLTIAQWVILFNPFLVENIPQTQR